MSSIWFLACLPLSTLYITVLSVYAFISLLLYMVYCCVPECTNYSQKTKDQGITYHRIPSEVTTHKAWIERIRRQNLPSLKNCYVCSTHFANDCFEYRAQLTGETSFRRLKETAVSSIFAFNKPKANKRRAASENGLQMRKKFRGSQVSAPVQIT